MAAAKGVYTQSFARLIQGPTVTGSDRKHFAEFRKVLAEEFPAVFRVCEVIRPGGDDSDAIMFKWKGASSARPVVLMAHQDVVPAVDGDWNTRWAAGSYHFPESVTVDLGGKYYIEDVYTLFEKLSQFQYKIEYSADGETWNIYADHTDNNEMVIEDFSEKTAIAEYVRITYTGSPHA